MASSQYLLLVCSLWCCRLCFAQRSERNETENDLQQALRIVQSVQNKTKCGSKVVYLNVIIDHKRWKTEALLSLEVANLMTSLWRVKNDKNYSIAEDDAFLYRTVRSIIMFSPQSFGSGICFDKHQYKDYYLFCPFAFKTPNAKESITVFDIASQDGGFDYSNDSNAIWWIDTKLKAITLSPRKQTEAYSVRLNATTNDKKRSFTLPVARYTDGVWTRPYFDCIGGKIWMVSYMAPFFNETDQFLGAVSMDIEFMHIDINQCDDSDADEPRRASDQNKIGMVSSPPNMMEFLGTHRCKPLTTKCVHTPHKGFRRGSYTCECRKGFYFPDLNARGKSFNGTVVESAHDALLEGENRDYETGFECLQCSEGCLECVDSSPCTYRENMMVRALLAAVNGVVLVMSVGFAVTVYLYRKHKVIKASSPTFLILTIVGIVIMYLKPFVSLTGPTNILCIVKQWLGQFGFLIAYSSIIIKTWRVAVIFRVRSAKRMALTDTVLMRRLLLILAVYGIFMILWTNIHPPLVSTWKTKNGLFFTRCSAEEWLEITAIVGDLGLLTWGMWVCYQVKNAPSAYNESKFVSWAIYNTMFVTCLATVLRFTMRNSTTAPDVMYVLEFVFIHTTATTMLLLILVHKFVHIRKTKQTNDTTSIHNALESHTHNQAHGNKDNPATMSMENEELRGQLERLANKVAVLQAKLKCERKKNAPKSVTSRRILCLGFSPATRVAMEKLRLEEELSEANASRVT